MDKLEYINILITNITNMCNKRNISPNQLGLKSGAGKDIIANLQKGSIISSDKLSKIADCLDCSVDYLLGRTEEPTSKAINNSYNKNGNNSVQTVGGTSEFSKRDVEILQKINSLDFKEYVDVINYINEIIKNKE